MNYVKEQESINAIEAYGGFLILCIITGLLGNIITQIIEHCPIIIIIGLITTTISITLILNNEHKQKIKKSNKPIITNKNGIITCTINKKTKKHPCPEMEKIIIYCQK